MDKPKIYGPVVHTLSFAEAARRGIICDYKVVISVVTSAMVNDHLLQHGKVIVDGDTVKARQVALQIALQKAVEKYGVSRIFTFHGSVAAARSFISEDGEGIRNHLPDFTTLHVSGEMRTSLREDHMKVFRQADKAVMSNARCLTEGVDVPAVDMVAFISPRKSKVDIVQATGRAMRKSPGKQFGYVMVPLFVEQTANESIEEALHRTGFSDIWDLLGAMKEQDDVLTDIIRQMREDKGRTGGYDENRFSERVEVLGPSVSLDTIRGSITTECLESLSSSWDERFGELLAFTAREGNCQVSGKYLTKDGYRLGQWVVVQRGIKDSLSAERKERLESLNGWVWDSLDAKWEANFYELQMYKAEHGDVNVPIKWHSSLGSWASVQRRSKKKGQLSTERKSRLDELGFEWDKLDSLWDDKCNELLAYYAEHGNVDLPQKHPSGLGAWLSQQKLYANNGKLQANRFEKLNSIPNLFENKKPKTDWDERFNELVVYKAEHGNLDVPRSWPTGLGTWVGNQKSFLRDGKLPAVRSDKLYLIGLAVNPLESRWENRFNELLEYKTNNGSVDVPHSWSTGLGQWVANQKNFARVGRMPDDRKMKLDTIGVRWESEKPRVTWEDRFNELLAFKTEHGNVNVPQSRPGLGKWVNKQRQAVKNDSLSSERKAKLESIGFQWNVKTRNN